MLRKPQEPSGDCTWVLEILIGPALAAHVLLYFLLASQKPDTRAEEPCVRTGPSVELGCREDATNVWNVAVPAGRGPVDC